MNFSNEIAPCGMNCSICRAYLRAKNPCPGCRGTDNHKPVTRLRCKIKNCELFQDGNAEFCFSCAKYPCEDLQHLDKRYRSKYRMSMIENLEEIKKSGITKFLENETVRWTCPACGGSICVHTGSCVNCLREHITKDRLK